LQLNRINLRTTASNVRKIFYVIIKSYWDALKKVGVTEYSIYPVDMNIKGKRAYTSGLWEATRVTAEGKTIKLSGNISNVLEKQADGSWKITVQSWN